MLYILLATCFLIFMLCLINNDSREHGKRYRREKQFHLCLVAITFKGRIYKYLPYEALVEDPEGTLYSNGKPILK